MSNSKTITFLELRPNLTQIFEEVRAENTTFTVTRFGKEIARIEPVPETATVGDDSQVTEEDPFS